MWSIYNFRRNLITKFIDKGYLIYILANKDNYYDKLSKLGCKFINIEFKRRNINLFSELFLFFKLIFLLNKYKPNYLLNFTIKPILIGGLASRILKIKYISTITGMGKMFTNKNNNSILGRILYRITNKKAYKVFVQNKHDLSYFLNDIAISKNQLKLIPGSGVDTDYFYESAYPKIKNKIIFTNISRLIKDKGIDEYLESAKIIKEKYNNIEFNLIGSEENEKKLTKKVKLYNKKSIINYYGHIDDVRKFIEKSHCVILTSYREGMPRSLLESSSMARPFISTNCIGSNELLLNNVNGIECNIKSVQSIVNAIEKFISLTFEDKRLLGKNARGIVLNKYKQEIIISEFIRIIN